MSEEKIREEILSRNKHNKVKSTFFSIRDGQLRRLVHHWRMQGYKIASDRNGYWGAETEEDRMDTLNFLKPKFLKVIDVYKKIENWKFKPFLVEEE